jgi:Glycosyltransferase family 87
MIRGAPLRKLAALVFLMGCAAWYWLQTVWNIIPTLGGASDFRKYYDAARQILEGHSPFAAAGYIYPPLLAELLTPLAHLDYLEARWVWFLISQAGLLAAAWLIWRAFGRDWPIACSIALVWATGGAAAEALWLGQLSPLLALLLATAYTSTQWRQGAALGVGFALKFIPGVPAIGLLLNRSRAGVSGFLASLSVLLALPWLYVSCCLSGPRTPVGTDMWTGTPAPLSWSLPSTVLRILDRPAHPRELPRNWSVVELSDLRLSADERAASVATAAIAGIAGALALFIAVGGRLSTKQLPWAMAGLLSLGLAASPVSWTHYQAMQYPGVAMLLAHAFRERRWILFFIALLCAAALYPFPVAVLGAYYRQHNTWNTVPLPVMYFWTSIATLASLVLFGLFVRESRRASAAASGEPAFTRPDCEHPARSLR